MKNYKHYFLILALICAASSLFGQGRTISGTVTDESGDPAVGVTVLVKGTSNAVPSDAEGNFSLLIEEEGTLVFSSIGFETQEISTLGQTTINVTLSEGINALDEVVVTALGIEKERKAIGYSLTEVGGEELATVKTTNAINSLQGKIAGVNITQNATGAAGSSRVIIRGSSSLTGDNQPLYVIDGIPIGNENNGAAGMWGGSDGGDGISALNPDDVESVSVLKGGAASALYGSRAAGGVILITTKSGKAQRGLGVEYNGSFLFDKVNTDLYDFQTEYGQGLRGAKPGSQSEALDAGLSSWGAQLDGSSVPQWDGVNRPYSYVGNNLDHFYRSGVTAINSLALVGGTNDITYRFSGSILDNKDVMPNAGLDRKTFSLNSSARLGNKLTTTVNAKYIVDNVENRPRLSDSPGNGNFTVASLSPNIDVRNMNPGVTPEGIERSYSNNTFSQNPYFAAFNFRNEDTRNRIIASTTATYDIFDWLYLRGRIGVDNSSIRRVSVTPFGTAFQPRGSINEQEIKYNQVDADVILGGDHSITDKIGVVAFVGTNRNHITEEQLSLSGNNFIVPGLEDIGNTVSQGRNRGFGERKIGSVYGSAEFSYDEFAFITFTGRNDWFSTLSFPGKESPNNDFYPSVSASLILSEALDLPNQFSFLKVRGGYSEVAGGASDPYQLALTYQIFGIPINGQPTGQINGNVVPNSNLVAFSKNETELGIDARLFDDRLFLDLAYYNNETSNDIVDVATSIFSGFGGAKANIGKIENKGIEFLIGGTPIQTEDFSWTTSFNGANNISEVLATNDTNSDVSLEEPRSRNARITHIVGERYGTIVGVSYERDASGNILYQIDGNGVPRAVEGARKVLGEGVPPLTFGFSNSLRYKDFTLNFLIDGKSGGQIFSGTNTVAYGLGLHQETLAGRENGLSVSGIDAATGQPFTTTVAPEDLSVYYGEINDIAEEFVDDADFIKFRQISLGYNLPSNMVKKTFLTGANVALTGSNLFFLQRSIENIDPESAYNVGNSQGLEYFGVPPARNFGFNVNLKF